MSRIKKYYSSAKSRFRNVKIDKSAHKPVAIGFVVLVLLFAGRRIFNFISAWLQGKDEIAIAKENYCKAILKALKDSNYSGCSITLLEAQLRAGDIYNALTEGWSGFNSGKLCGALVESDYRQVVEKAINKGQSQSLEGSSTDYWNAIFNSSELVGLAVVVASDPATLKEKFIMYKEDLSLNKNDYKMIHACFGIKSSMGYGWMNLQDWVNSESKGEVSELVNHIWDKSEIQ